VIAAACGVGSLTNTLGQPGPGRSRFVCHRRWGGLPPHDRRSADGDH